jgi:hypothetical protein
VSSYRRRSKADGRSGSRARRSTGFFAAIGALCAVAAVAAPVASASPEWKIEATWAPAHLPPGGIGQLNLLVRNEGDKPTSGLITIKDQLPPGVSVDPTNVYPPAGWACFGTTTVTCTSSVSHEGMGPGTAESGGSLPWIRIGLKVSPGASGVGTNLAQMWGGGATRPDGSPCASGSPGVPCATDIDPVTISPEPAGFGVTPGSYHSDIYDAERPLGDPERQAGTHPFEFRTDFAFNMKTTPISGTNSQNGATPDDHVRTAVVTLPPGISGNPESTPKCSQTDFLVEGSSTFDSSGCAPETQVGTMALDLQFNSGIAKRVAIYNLEPPRGQVADFGFRIAVVSGHIYPTLDPAQGYAIKATTPFISDVAPARSARVTIWGVPADPAHDQRRAHPALLENGDAFGASSNAAIKPLLTMPMDCGIDNGAVKYRADSWGNPGVFTYTYESEYWIPPSPPTQPEWSTEPNHLEVGGCDDPRIRFTPDISLQPTNRDAGGPTGLAVHLESPQRDNTVDDADKLYAPNGNVHGVDTPPIKKVVVTFPEGMTLSPSAAQGLGNCSSAEIGLGTDSPVRCPENSRYGALTLHTPVLPADEPMVGDIFIAKQNDNPFKNFLTMYFVIHDESRGLLVKLPGKIDLDPKTGQIRTTFDDLPQFPVTDMELSFKGGVRAALVNPTTCGQKTIKAEFFSWHDPSTPNVVNSNYDVTRKPDGSPCVNTLAERPFAPQLSAGSVNPNAGSYSPFVFRLTRSDDDQEFSQLSTTLPPGLLANISGITECSEASIAQAAAPERTGIAEQLFPSCPASSQIGTTDVGTGVGVPLTYVPGKAYLAGPYRGEPLSLVVISPAVVGPYDLGVIAVRSAIHVDAQRGQATIATDPFPQVFEGIPVRIRDIRVKADRPATMINPTNCDPMAVGARVTGTGGNLESTADDSAVELSDRFQAANCQALPFKPKLSFRLKGGTKRGDLPAFSAYLKGRPGDANIARSTVVLPGSLFIEQGHIRTVCTRVQFAADQCPEGSVYGTASAKSPLFDEVLSGPVYLRSNGGERLLPDLVVKLDGKIEVVLAGFIDSLDSRVRNTFNVVPDAPVDFFSLKMKGGKRALVINHRDLCTAPSRAGVQLTGQNGKTYNTKPKVAVNCGKAKKAKAKRKAAQ